MTRAAAFQTTTGQPALIERYDCPICQGPERATYLAIARYIARHDYAPTLGELAALTGLSKSVARSHRDRLAEAGYLDVIPRTARGMRLR